MVARTKTQIDPRSDNLWCRMGLPLDDSGRWSADTHFTGTSASARQDQENIALYELIRLMCRLINDPASGDEPVTPASVASPRARPTQDGYWANLQHEFDLWYSVLPPSFHPDGVLPSHDEHKSSTSLFNEETWFSKSTCAVAIAYYHMARMLLLIQQPSSLTLAGNSGKGSHFDLLHAYRSVQEEMRRHAKQVISIALGMPYNMAMIYMIQPLYVSGRCLTNISEQERLVNILQSIQMNFGCSTEYRIRDLCADWDVILDPVCSQE